MKLIFIGSGSAFTLNDNYQSNMLLLDENIPEKLLIDCGSDARHALARLHYSYRDITDVYISHLHADHIGGLEWLAFSTKFDVNCKKPNLYISSELVNDLWEKALSAGLSTLQIEQASLSSFFNLHAISKNGIFQWQNISFQTVQTIHAMSGYSLISSHGLIFNIKQTKIFITTDTQLAPKQLIDFYRTVDIIFQDCELTTPASGLHAHFDQLITLDSDIKSKMWLYHYDAADLPDAKAYGFLGFVRRGQEFTF